MAYVWIYGNFYIVPDIDFQIDVIKGIANTTNSRRCDVTRHPPRKVDGIVSLRVGGFNVEIPDMGESYMAGEHYFSA